MKCQKKTQHGFLRQTQFFKRRFFSQVIGYNHMKIGQGFDRFSNLSIRGFFCTYVGGLKPRDVQGDFAEISRNCSKLAEK